MLSIVGLACFGKGGVVLEHRAKILSSAMRRIYYFPNEGGLSGSYKKSMEKDFKKKLYFASIYMMYGERPINT